MADTKLDDSAGRFGDFSLFLHCLYNKGSCCSILKCFTLQWFVLGAFGAGVLTVPGLG